MLMDVKPFAKVLLNRLAGSWSVPEPPAIPIVVEAVIGAMLSAPLDLTVPARFTLLASRLIAPVVLEPPISVPAWVTSPVEVPLPAVPLMLMAPDVEDTLLLVPMAFSKKTPLPPVPPVPLMVIAPFWVLTLTRLLLGAELLKLTP